MAGNSPPPPFFSQKAIDKVKVFPHHSSVSALWETKWKKPCSLGVYPFVDAKLEDFEPIFQRLIKAANDHVSILLDSDVYAQYFIPVGQKLSREAKAAEDQGDLTSARDLYLRAAAVFRIGRFPLNRSKLSQQSWGLGKEAYSKGSRYLDPPYIKIEIPFKHANITAGDKDQAIQSNLRIPKGNRTDGVWPIILLITGLDGFRTDVTDLTTAHNLNGFAVICIEIPGTGDCPAARNDPESPDRLWSSVFEWISANSSQYGLDSNRIIARGVSTGDYYAFRIAHTHADHLIGAVGQGGWSHYALKPEWLRAMNHMEYPFALGDAFAYKLGYKSIEEMVADDAVSKFSLELNGKIFDRMSCRLLIVNGLEDSIFPIEDSILVASRGRPKDVRFVEGRAHVGDPEGEQVIYDWINELVAGE